MSGASRKLSLVPKGPVAWAEISTDCERKRFNVLASFLQENGLENDVSFIELEGPQFIQELNSQDKSKNIYKSFAQIRIGGGLRELATQNRNKLPSTLLSLRMADALVQEEGEWWPRCFLAEGLLQAIAVNLAKLDLLGSVFVLGASPEARAIVAALVRVGFLRFAISDPNEGLGMKLVEELRSIYFRTQFQFVSRNLITQLPGVYSFAVNTLKAGQDEGSIGELFYFNFLKPSGVWLDLPFGSSNPELKAEAESVGALVLSGSKVAAKTDQLWVERCFGIQIDPDRYETLLTASLADSDV